MKPVVIGSNMLNEVDQLKGWVDNMKQLTDAGIFVVDGGSTDGTVEYLESRDVFVVKDNIIQREGYSAARNQMRKIAAMKFPHAHWFVYFDADERIDECDFHNFRCIKDQLDESKYDVIAFPRLDWHDESRKKCANDLHIKPDYQGRMTRIYSPLSYARKCHEILVGFIGIYAVLTNPKIQHYHRSAGQEKRDLVGKLCAKLHAEDDEHGQEYPKHHKEDMYYNRFLEEGL